MADLKSILSDICKVELNYKRLNEIEIGTSTYKISSRPRTRQDGTSYDFICLIDEEGNEYAVSVKQLAGLRIVPSSEALKSVWFDDWKSTEGASVFKTKALELEKLDVDLGTVRFKVVHQLKIRNEFAGAPNTPVYQDYCYSGKTEYKAKVLELVTRIKASTKDYWDNQDYKSTMPILREKLHATPLLNPNTSDAHVVKLPVFQLI
jgi:hypothetical protein